jgi:hypothetical protein
MILSLISIKIDVLSSTSKTWSGQKTEPSQPYSMKYKTLNVLKIKLACIIWTLRFTLEYIF